MKASILVVLIFALNLLLVFGDDEPELKTPRDINTFLQMPLVGSEVELECKVCLRVCWTTIKLLEWDLDHGKEPFEEDGALTMESISALLTGRVCEFIPALKDEDGNTVISKDDMRMKCFHFMGEWAEDVVNVYLDNKWHDMETEKLQKQLCEEKLLVCAEEKSEL